MIKFFKKIRQNLLYERKTGKYLKYAVGQIILVVIGILIALKINNWNESNKKRNLKKEYVVSLKTDLVKDTSQLNNRLKQNKKMLRILALTKDSINNRYISTSMDFIRLYRNLEISTINTFNTYNTNSFSTLISSGNIDLFEKKQRNPIMELSKLQNQEKEISKFNNEVLFTVLENTAMKYPSKDNSYNIEMLDELWRQSNNEDLPKDLIHFL